MLFLGGNRILPCAIGARAPYPRCYPHTLWRVPRHPPRLCRPSWLNPFTRRASFRTLGGVNGKRRDSQGPDARMGNVAPTYYIVLTRCPGDRGKITEPTAEPPRQRDHPVAFGKERAAGAALHCFQLLGMPTSGAAECALENSPSQTRECRLLFTKE